MRMRRDNREVVVLARVIRSAEESADHPVCMTASSQLN